MGSPKAPQMPPPPPPAPGVDQAKIDARNAKAAEERSRRQQAGRASTILTGGQGVTDEGKAARKVLLGG